MPILTHGSDLTLAPTIRPVVKQTDGTVRTAIDQLVRAGFKSVQLDATLPGIRPRDLDQRARRDLLSVLLRQSMTLAGLDLFIPRRDFVEPEKIDRAMTAAMAAISLAADLGRVPLSLSLPVKTMSEDLRSSLVEAADGHGIRLAIHAEEQFDALLAWVETVDLPALGAAVDPAAVLVQGQNPASAVNRLKKHLAVARLSDVSGSSGRNGSAESEAEAAGGLRCAVGEGDLDVIEYRVALDLAAGRTGPVVLDLRGMENPLHAAAQAQQAWGKAAFSA